MLCFKKKKKSITVLFISKSSSWVLFHIFLTFLMVSHSSFIFSKLPFKLFYSHCFFYVLPLITVLSELLGHLTVPSVCLQTPDCSLLCCLILDTELTFCKSTCGHPERTTRRCISPEKFCVCSCPAPAGI